MASRLTTKATTMPVSITPNSRPVKALPASRYLTSFRPLAPAMTGMAR